MTEHDERQRQLALKVVNTASHPNREALRLWAGALLELREKKMPTLRKAKAAIQITVRAKIIWPLLKQVSRHVKKHGWDDRSISQRLGLGSAGAALALFGGANAGIAALGGAIGVPLWVVFGAGAMFARHLYEELGGNKGGDAKATYSVLDAEREED